MQIREQVEDLRLDRHVEGGDRLIGDDEPGGGSQRGGDADALALSSRELVRVAVEEPAREGRVQPDAIQEVEDPGPPVRLRPDREGVERFGNARPHAPAWIDRGERILEHGLDLLPEGGEPTALQRQHVLSVEDDPACRGFDQAQDAARERALPGARLADDGEHLAREDLEVDPVDGVELRAATEQAAVGREMFHETGDLQDRAPRLHRRDLLGHLDLPAHAAPPVAAPVGRPASRVASDNQHAIT